MFDIDNNSVIYNDWLKPDEGYELHFGVCCTYSLDLEAVAGTMLALGLDNDLGNAIDNPVALLTGFQKMSNKLAFFCSDCAIKSAGTKFNKIVNILDNAIFEVKPKSGGIFHPKLWFLYYTPLKQSKGVRPYIRLLVLTKNLTFDQSLDFGVNLRASVYEKNESKKANQPLVKMLDYLRQFMTTNPSNGGAANNRLDLFDELRNAFEKAEIFDFNNKFEYILSDNKKHASFFSGCEFIPIGIDYNEPLKKLDYLLDNRSKDWAICVSPFLTNDIIDKIFQNAQSDPEDCYLYDSALLTRMETLAEQKSVRDNVFEKVDSCFCVKPEFGEQLNEETNQDNSDAVPNAAAALPVPAGNIHAKMYFVGIDDVVYFYTGSANATYSAFNKNVEFLIRLKLSKIPQYYHPRYKDICDLLNLRDSESDGAAESPFINVTPDDFPDDVSESGSQDVSIADLRKLTEMVEKAHVEQTPDSAKYKVSFDIAFPPEFHLSGVTIAPNGNPNAKTAFQPGACVEGLNSAELSDLYIIEIAQDNSLNLPPKTFVKKIPTTGIPETRDQDITKSIIKDVNDFSLWVNMLLSYRPLSALSRTMRLIQRSSQNQSSNSKSTCFSGLFEDLLRLAVDNPQQLKEFAECIERNIPQTSPDEFKSMLDEFKKMLEAFNSKD